MKYFIFVTMLFLSSISNANPLMERDTHYFGFFLSNISYQYQLPDDSVSNDVKFNLYGFRLGTFLFQHIAFEVRGGVPESQDALYTERDPYDLEMDFMAGVYALPHITLGDNASVNLLVGYTHFKGSYRNNDSDDMYNHRYSSVSFGAGVNFYISSRFALNGEYVRYVDGYDHSIDTYSFGFQIFY